MSKKSSSPAHRIIVVASTFPASSSDSVPAFVRDQVIAMHVADPDTEYHVLAPHVYKKTKTRTRHAHFYEHRFHYAIFKRLETLTAHGIMPALKQNPLYYALVPALFIGEFVELLRLTRRLKPAYLYAHWFTPQAIVASWVSTLTRTPFVFTTHAADVDVWHKLPWIGRRIVRYTSKHARAITAVSPRSMKKLESFFTPEQWQALAPRTRVIPMGTHLPQPDAHDEVTPNKTDETDNTKMILFMGRLAEKKGVSYLLDAFNELNDPTIRLVIAGDGPLRQTLEKQAETLKSAQAIEFVGYVSGQKKARYLKRADILVLPSIITSGGDAEGLPVVFMEGLAAGKICIATNESGADNIIQNQESGFLLPHKDSPALTKTLRHALALSPAATKRMQQNARHVARQFDWAKIASDHLDFLFSKR